MGERFVTRGFVGRRGASGGVDVTATSGRCAHCGTVSVVGTLRAYTRGPGIVLRCPACEGAVIRIVETPGGLRVDSAAIRLGADGDTPAATAATGGGLT